MLHVPVPQVLPVGFVGFDVRTFTYHVSPGIIEMLLDWPTVNRSVTSFWDAVNPSPTVPHWHGVFEIVTQRICGASGYS